METWKTYAPHGWSQTAEWSRRPDNENLRLLSHGITAAEALQWIKREKEEMRRELAANFQLRSDPKHRLLWENLEAIGRCTRQRYYGDP